MGKKRKRKKKKKRQPKRSYHRVIVFILALLAIPIGIYFFSGEEDNNIVRRNIAQPTTRETDSGLSPFEIRKNRMPNIIISRSPENFFNKWNILGRWKGKEFQVFKGEERRIVYEEVRADIFFLEGRRYYMTRDCFEERLDESEDSSSSLSFSDCGIRAYQSVNFFPFERVFTNKLANQEVNDFHFFNDITLEYSDDPDFTDTFYPKAYRLYDDWERMDFQRHVSTLIDEEGNLKKSCEEGSSEDDTCKEDPQIWLRRVRGGKRSLVDPKKLGAIEKDVANPSSIAMFQRDEYVIQKYVHNPLLIGGKMCSIKKYILVASLEPLLVLSFDDDYSLEDMEQFLRDPSMHIAHRRIEKKKGVKVRPILDLKMLEYEMKKDSESGTFTFLSGDEETLTDHINNNINRISSYVIKTFRNFLFEHPGFSEAFDLFGSKHDEIPHFYGLYSMDSVMDEEGKLWVSELEYLVDFDLKEEDPIEDRMLKNLAHEMMGIVNEVQIVRNEFRHDPIGSENLEGYKKRLVDLESVKDFVWVIQGDVDLYPTG